MKTQEPQTHHSPIRLHIDSEARIRESLEEYRRSIQAEAEMLARGEPIFIIPEPTPWELAQRQRHEARQKRLEELPDFYIPSEEELAAEKARQGELRQQRSSKSKRVGGRKTFLPSRLTTDQLALYGYQLTSSSATTAKHKRFRSYRHFCWLCQQWTKGGSGGVCERHSFA